MTHDEGLTRTERIISMRHLKTAGGVLSGLASVLLLAGTAAGQTEDPERKQAMVDLGLAHETAWDLYQALVDEAGGGQPLEWSNVPDWSGVYSRGGQYLQLRPGPGPGTDAHGQTHTGVSGRTRAQARPAGPGSGIRQPEYLRTARAPALADRTVSARVRHRSPSDLADQRNGQRRPPRVHGRAPAHARRRSLSPLQRRFPSASGTATG